MEKKTRRVTRSQFLDEDLADIYQYGTETFGLALADAFLEEIYQLLIQLSTRFYSHPECKFIPTKDKVYRNIIFGSYLIIYRVYPDKIEVLRAFHSSRSPAAMPGVFYKLSGSKEAAFLLMSISCSLNQFC
jgi:toxin ParE1/3/4